MIFLKERKFKLLKNLMHFYEQSGRSMIEMLGVLVIIGVLSVAALFGFTYALNKHRANETIHDVMLRASNVPMTDEYYQTRPTGYAFKFPDLQDELSSMGYTLNTVKNSEYGYVYKVEAEAIPYRVCNMILRLEPTDIDEIRIGADKAVYKRGLWDLCETHVDEATDTVLMSFYFEKVCKTNADCSDCQECYQGRCKANYNLPGCGFVPPDPPIPIPDESCLETVEYQYGDNCEYTGECCINPLAEGCPPSCTPKGCPTAPTCGTCEEYRYDKHGCPVGCEAKKCEPCPSGEVEIGQDTCGCPICQSDECPDVGTEPECSELIEDTTSVPGEVCYTWGPTQLTTKSEGECCDSVVDCCPLRENCSEECHPLSCEDVFGEVPSGEDPACYEVVVGGTTEVCGEVCSEDGYKKKACTPCSAGEEETGTDVCGCPICEEKCPDLSCDACQEPNYESCTCEPKVCNLECPEGTSPVGDDGCGCPTECTTCPDLSCGVCEEPNYESCVCEEKVCALECEEGEEATGYDSCGCPTGCSRPCMDDSECSGSCSVCEGGYCVDKTEQQDISECCDGSLYTSCCPLNGNNCGCTFDTCDLVVPEIPVGQEACYESVPEGGEICGEVCSGGYKKKACPSGDHCPEGEREIGRDECGCPYCEPCPEDEFSCGTECCVADSQFCCGGDTCCPVGHACCEGVCCGEGQVCGNNGTCCPEPPASCGPCEELVLNENGCSVCKVKSDCECPEFNGCSSCEIETVDENGCPICESNCAGSCEVCENGSCVDQTVWIETGLCCDEGEVACCPLTDTCDACTITDISQCECEEGYQRTPLGDCIECPIANIATGNRYAPCIVSSAGSIDVVAPGNYGCCCIGGGEDWYPKGDGSGECISCVPPKIFDGYDGCICEEGEECGINCCGEGERCINESSCCPEAQICENELFSTCCPDGQICVNGSCEEPCSEEAPVPCSLNGESWCCAEGNTCGTTTGQCCQDGVCCSDGQKAYWNGSSVGCCSTETHKIVKNYKDGVGEYGYACCEVKKDTYFSQDDELNDMSVFHSETGWTIVGATNGICCGGYTQITGSVITQYEDTATKSSSYRIRENGGIYYCAVDYFMNGSPNSACQIIFGTYCEKGSYISDNKYCFDDAYCYCADKGDPSQGSRCN